MTFLIIKRRKIQASSMRLYQSLIILLGFLFSAANGIYAAEPPREPNELEILAQQDPIAALPQVEKAIEKAKLDQDIQAQLDWLGTKATIFQRLGDMNQMLLVCEQGRDLAASVRNDRMWALFMVVRGEALSQMGQWTEAKESFRLAIDTLTQEKLEQDLVFANSKLGLAYYYNKEYDDALKVFSETYDSIPPEYEIVRAGILANMALVYEATGNLDKAIEFHKKNLAISEGKVPEGDLMIVKYNIGYSYLSKKDYAQAEDYLRQAEKTARELNIVQGIAFVTSQLGALSEIEKNYERSYRYFSECHQIAEKLNNRRLILMCLGGLMKASIELEDFNQAIAIQKQALPMISPDDKSSVLGMQKLEAELAAKQGNYREAVANYQALVEQMREMHKEQNESKIQEMQARFNNRLQEQENRALKQQNELQALSLSFKEKQQLIYLLSFIALFSVLLTIVIILRKEKLNRQRFATLAMTDELTGVANRRAILGQAKVQFDHFKSDQSESLLAMVDLDHFKQINDQYGHDIGDEVLKAFAKAIKKVIRDQDYFGRIGGEEWLLILPRTDQSIISVIFNRMKEEVSKIVIEGLDRPITFSMGVTRFVKTDHVYETAAKRADEGLYEAKRAGRDQFVFC